MQQLAHTWDMNYQTDSLIARELVYCSNINTEPAKKNESKNKKVDTIVEIKLVCVNR